MPRPTRKNGDFSAEIEAHIQHQADRLVERGMDQAEALDAARRAFGNLTKSQERFYESQRWLWWDALKQDLRLAVRLLAKTPGWTAVAAMTVALGIGATAAIFSIVNVVLLRPLPFRDAQQLYSIIEGVGSAGPVQFDLALAMDYLTMRDQIEKEHEGRAIADMAAYAFSNVNWSGNGLPQQLSASLVTASFFPVLGARPLRGRIFRTDEDSPGAERVVVLSYRTWQRRFAGNPAILGETIRLDRQPARVIGIMPSTFDFPNHVDLWTPLAEDREKDLAQRGSRLVTIVARARPGATRSQVDDEMDNLTASIGAGRDESEMFRVRAQPLQRWLSNGSRPTLLTFMGAAVLTLLIVCSNVANLMLARATARRREIAVRVALGAPRRRIAAQLITESLLLSLLGSALGMGLAAVTMAALNSSSQLQQFNLPQLSINAIMVGFTFGLAVLTGLVFGIAPALSSLGFSVHEALQRETRSATSGTGSRRLRQALVVAQLGLSLTLLIGAGLLGESFLRLRRADPGFRPDKVLTARVSFEGENDAAGNERVAFLERLVEEARRVPGVESAAVTNAIPATGAFGNFGGFHILNRPLVSEEKDPETVLASVSADFFKVLGIPLRAGRPLPEHPTAEPAAVINEAFARRFFPNEDPVGQHIALDWGAKPTLEIVGVTGDMRLVSLDREPDPTV